jgi:peptidoglycan/xylan/chitin deacetylase (PgdA/CDA1 family)
VRIAFALAAIVVPLCLPVGGGSEAYVPAGPAMPAPAVQVSSPAGDAPLTADPRVAGAARPGRAFPRFLHTLNNERSAVPDLRSRTRDVLLSFDDGPDLAGTPLVLETLDRYQVKAIFFVNGRSLLGSRPPDLARRELVRRLATHGHLVANHTLTHRNLCREPGAVAEEIDTNSEIIGFATGLRPLLFRSPYGARCRSLDQALRQRDLIQVGWNLDPQEWRCQKQEQVFAHVTRRLARLIGPAILLLHDTHEAAVLALPRILEWIDQENARLARDGGRPLRVVDYSVLFPDRDLPATGLEPLLEELGASLGVLPGVSWLAMRARKIQ